MHFSRTETWADWTFSLTWITLVYHSCAAVFVFIMRVRTGKMASEDTFKAVSDIEATATVSKLFILVTLISYEKFLSAKKSASWHFRMCSSCCSSLIFDKPVFTFYWRPWMTVSSHWHSPRTCLVSCRLLGSIVASLVKNCLRFFEHDFQNTSPQFISSSLSSLSSLSFSLSLNNEQLLNVKKLVKGFWAALTASTTGGRRLPSANVTVKKILLPITLPKVDRIEL